VPAKRGGGGGARSHLAIVSNDPEAVNRCLKQKKQIAVNIHMAGIITLEDVIEALIDTDLRDETDADEEGSDAYYGDSVSARQLAERAVGSVRAHRMLKLAREMGAAENEAQGTISPMKHRTGAVPKGGGGATGAESPGAALKQPLLSTK
jgi:hypothetical protein